MKAAISTDNGYVSAHFGRCPEFTIVSIENNQVKEKKVIANPGHQPGFLPSFLRQQGVNAIIAGGMGPRALALFEEAGIRPILGVSGLVDEVIEQLGRGVLQSGESTCSPGAGKDYGVPKSVCDSIDASGEQHSPQPEQLQGKVCLSAQGDSLDAQVDPRFGRCAWFIIYDFSDNKFEAIANKNSSSPSGAGIASAQQVADRKVQAVLTGNVGPNAFGVLDAAGIKVITGVQGMSVQQALQKFSGNELKPCSGPSVNGHHGL